MYNDNERALIWLNNFVNISTKKKLALLDLFDSPYEMFEEFLNYSEEITNIVGINNYKLMSQNINELYVDNLINSLMIKNVSVITKESADYPDKLLDALTDPPIVLLSLIHI